MKRFLVVLLCVALGLTLIACGNSAALTEPTPYEPESTPYVAPTTDTAQEDPQDYFYENEEEPSADYGDPVTDVVYITNSGEKYHRDGCRYLRKSQIEISREDAIAQGYEPCKVCKP